MAQQPQCLVIGYGNTLRSDDGAGQRIAERVAEWHLPQVQTIAVHQLAPELAEPLAAAKVAIFVDVYPAQDKTRTVQVVDLEPGHSVELQTLGHTANPQSLLTLSRQLYGSAPLSWWILVPAVNFEFGEEFSPVTRQGVTVALDQIKQLIEKTDRCSGESP